MSKLTLLIIITFCTILLVSSEQVIANKKSSLDIKIEALTCTLETIQNSGSQSISISPDDCIEEQVIEALQGGDEISQELVALLTGITAASQQATQGSPITIPQQDVQGSVSITDSSLLGNFINEPIGTAEIIPLLVIPFIDFLAIQFAVLGKSGGLFILFARP